MAAGGLGVWRVGCGVSGAKAVEVGQIVLIGLLSEEAQMSAKLGFAAGLAVGVLAGSRAGRGIYDRSAAAASAVVHDPRVRSGASSALHRAGSAGSTVAGAAARKVTGKGKGNGQDGEKSAEGAGGEGKEGERGKARRGSVGGNRGRGRIGEMGEVGAAGSRSGSDSGSGSGESRIENRVRMKRLMGGVRGHRRGAGAGGAGGDGAYGHVGAGGWVSGARGHVFSRHSENGSHHSRSGVSAPSVQPKPKGEGGGEAQQGINGEGGGD